LFGAPGIPHAFADSPGPALAEGAGFVAGADLFFGGAGARASRTTVNLSCRTFVSRYTAPIPITPLLALRTALELLAALVLLAPPLPRTTYARLFWAEGFVGDALAGLHDGGGDHFVGAF